MHARKQHKSRISPQIEHRLFSFVSLNWRGRPLESLQVIIDLIGSTTTSTGLKGLRASRSRRVRERDKVTDTELAAVNIVRDEFHPDWNYTIHPNQYGALIMS